MSRLTASRAAFDLIASFEGFRTRAALAPDGQWTLGFGHTATAREGLSVTRQEAEDLLRWDLLPIEDMVRQFALTPLSQNQFDALVSFAYNIGIDNFRSSDVLKYLNQGQIVAAALSMHAWRRAPINGRVLTIDALVRRRAAESALFLETIGARPAAPSSVIRPQIDNTAALLSNAPDPATASVQVKSDAVHQDAGLESGIKPVVDESVTLAVEPTPTPTSSEVETLVPLELATSSLTVSEATQQDVLSQDAPVVLEAPSPEQDNSSQGPIILPPLPIPPPADLANGTQKNDASAETLSQVGPIVPNGLSPFPGNVDYTPANGTSDTMPPPANDGLKTRLHNSPEMLPPAQPDVSQLPAPKSDENKSFSLLVWGFMILGAALLAFGLYFSWKSGILTVTTPRRVPTNMELGALLAAASGFIILITSAVSALTSDRDAQ